MDSFDSLPSNVQVEALSYVANDRSVSWPVLLRLRTTSRIFDVEILKQLKNAKIVEKDYCSDLRKSCAESDKTKRASLTSDFLRFFLPKISHALYDVFLSRPLLHEAAASGLTIGPPESPQTLDFVKTIHLLICSADCFNWIDIISRATPAVETLIVEYIFRDNPCSNCVPHEINRFWNAVQWNLAQIRRLAFVGFVRYANCCPAFLRNGKIPLYNCNNLIALDLRDDDDDLYDDIRARPLGTDFPHLQELRLCLRPYTDSRILGEVAACPNLKFLDLMARGTLALFDPLFINQLQVLTRLTHLHIDLRDCDLVAFSGFFRRQDIQLTHVSILTDDHSSVLIKDVVECNPGLQVFVLDVFVWPSSGLDAVFGGLPGLADLTALICYVRCWQRQAQPSSFLTHLDPAVHSKLQVAALTLTQYDPPEEFAGMIEQVRQRFAGHRVNGRPAEILFWNGYRGHGLPIREHISENYPDFTCCVEPHRRRYRDFRPHFSSNWKAA